MKLKLVALFIAVSVSVTFFYQARQWAYCNPHNSITPFAFTGMVQGIHSDHFQQLGLPWKPRVGAMWLTAELFRAVRPTTLESYQDLFGSYNAVWFFASLCLLIGFCKEPVFLIALTFAGAMYAITVTTYNSFYDDVHILPWDFPAMFFFTLSFLLWTRKQYWLMVVAIIIGTLFKESVALTAILLLMRPTFGKQWIHFAVAFIGCLILRLFITHYVIGSATPLTAGHSAQGEYWESLKRFTAWEFHPHLNSIIWCNAGMMAMVWFLKPSNIEEIGIIVVLAMFSIFLTITPIIDKSCYEVRHWTDVLPMLAIYFQSKTRF